jgi:hypothetical protein
LKVKIKKKYLKRSYVGRNPVHFHAKQPEGIKTTVHAKIHLDPILKKHRDLRKPMLKHEERELHRWGMGHKDAHKYAVENEPKKLKRIGSADGFWKEIKKRGN